MNRKFPLYLAFALALASCAGEEDDIFSQSAAERLNEASDIYSARLTAQPNGWAMQLYPTNDQDTVTGRGYLVLLRFHKNHQVDAAMNNFLTNYKYTADTSMWEVITDDGPVLTFNTYNDVIHAFSDPEDLQQTGTGEQPDDETGVGIGGDYEFIIVDAPDDATHMMLKGKKRATYNYLTPMEEGVDFQAYMNDVQAFQARMFPVNAPSPDYMHYGDSLCYMVEGGHGLPNIYPVGGDAVIDESFNPFIVTKLADQYYLRFRDAKTFGDVTVQNYRYDRATDRFVSTDNDAFYIEGSDPTTFFPLSLTVEGNYWSLRSDADMSPDFNAAFAAMVSQFQSVNKNYRPTRVVLRIVDGQFVLHVPYANQERTFCDVALAYRVNADGTITFTNDGPANEASGNIMRRITAIQAFADLLCSKTYAISAATTRFDLSRIRLTAPDGSYLNVRL